MGDIAAVVSWLNGTGEADLYRINWGHGFRCRVFEGKGPTQCVLKLYETWLDRYRAKVGHSTRLCVSR